MSDFVPGFASRHALAGDALARAFAAGGGFAVRDPAGMASNDVADIAPAPRHFSPADRATNPTEGWDPFDARIGADHPGGTNFSDPIAAARERGFAEGRAAALAELESTQARETALLGQVSDALAKGAHFDRDRMAGHLRQTVLFLVNRLIGEAGIAPDVLAGRIESAVDLLSDTAESALLRVHPDDVALLEGKLPKNVFPVGDPNVTRGGFALESASTIVEDGPDLWLEQLAEAIDRVPIPPTC
jgi:flagellar assembly protein FliH